MLHEAYAFKGIMSRFDIHTPRSSDVGEIQGWHTGPTLVAIALLSEIVPSQVAR